MPRKIDIKPFLQKAENIPVVDVRTPAEYKQGHIPIAHNIPLFTDRERKSVGISYKQEGKREALMKGLDIAGPKMTSYVRKAQKIARNQQLLVHCWRGGMRSESMAWLFETAGMECHLLEGGYKSFRQYVLSSFSHDLHCIVVGGLTGAGKTAVLKSLAEQGEQILDLEGLAHHKGSAFGNLGEKEQPSTEHFENKICWELLQMDRERTIWIEDESRSIGRNILPAGIFNQIRSSPVIFLDVPRAERVDRLVKDYAGFSADELGEGIRKISKRLGGSITQKAIQSLNSGDYRLTAEMMLRYYDKTYLYGLGERDPHSVFRLSVINAHDTASVAGKILTFARQNPGLIHLNQ
jgi:tRNA 2-selenouridine synthase